MSTSTERKTLNGWMREVHSLARMKGWHEKPTVLANGEADIHAVGTKLMLVNTELAEAFEELRAGRSHAEVRRASPQSKPEGFAVELADALIRILDLAGAMNIDIEDVVATKHEFNRHRPHRHGGKRA